MLSKGAFVKFWLPVLVWMVLIFSVSSDSRSSQHSSRIIGPIVRWLNPDISDAALEQVVFTVRKTAHVTEYAILAMLLWWARRKPTRGDARPWGWSEAFFAVGISALYAATDELHQALVPQRDARIMDVLIDAAGAVVGIGFVWLWWRIRCNTKRGRVATNRG